MGYIFKVGAIFRMEFQSINIKELDAKLSHSNSINKIFIELQKLFGFIQNNLILLIY